MAQPYAAELPAVLAAALSADNEQRKQAEARIASLSKDPALIPALVEQLRGIAAAKGFDLSVLAPVQQSGCSYAPFPENAAPAPFAGAPFSG